MNLQDLIQLTRVYTRDVDSNIFDTATITLFINQSIDRIKQFNVFKTMTKLSALTDEVKLMPSEYHYLLALFASSRLFDIDQRYSEGSDKRNEFEYYYGQLIEEIQCGTVVILNDLLIPIIDTTDAIDYVTDEYYGSTVVEEV